VQCSVGSDQRSSLARLEERIIDSQKHLFLKTDKILKAQNDKIMKLTKLVDAQNETIGTLDARLEIIYRFLNKEIKDMEGRMMTKLDTISTSFTNQFVYSLPYALGPAMGALASIQKQVDVLCKGEALNSTTASDFDNTCSEALDPQSEDNVRNVVVDPNSEVGGAHVPEREDLIVIKSIVNQPANIDINVETKYAEVRDESPDKTENLNNNNSEHAGLKFIYKSLGLPCETNHVSGNLDQDKEVIKVDEIMRKDEANHKRKHGDLVDVNEVVDIVEGEDLEDGEILDDEQISPVVPIGRVTVRTGIFKDEVMKSKKRKRTRK